jgi:hydroxymethylbilane synthase
VGAYATVAVDGRVTMTAMIGTPDGRIVMRDTDSDDDPRELGRRLARHLLDDAGGSSLLADLR